MIDVSEQRSRGYTKSGRSFMMMVRKISAFSIFAFALVAAGGCAVDAVDETDESVQKSEAFLGEAACFNDSCNGDDNCSLSLAMKTPPSCSFAFTEVTSRRASYGTAACPNVFAAPVFGRVGRSFLPYVAWGDTALTSANCAGATLQLAVYAKRDGQALTTRTSRYHGVWIGGIINTCEFRLDAGSSNPVAVTLEGPGAKLAGAAFLNGSKRKVTLGVRTGTGPC